MPNTTKDRIKASFNASWQTYDQSCQVQQQVCEKAIRLLKQYRQHFPVIADVACGSGISTQTLLQNIQHNQAFAIDFSDKLIALAKKKSLPNTKVILADFDEKLFTNKTVDLIFCNMGLQWSLNLQNTLQRLYYYLNDAGILLFSLPIEGTFYELDITHRNAHYPLAYIENVLHDCGFQNIESCHKIYIKHYQSSVDALRSLKNTGAHCLKHNTTKRNTLSSKKLIKHLFNNASAITLTYNIGFFMAQKNSSKT